ncbi:MAG TPA: succinate dehydrogenase flavoprotein subunit, partial [Candidatus Kapabacteria bacterium]|nr:succinate dehydrogenase flavoprotein subunit [Candidatus Kapabacteria bacterium]
LGNLEEDTPEWHAFDTIKGSDYLGDQDAIEVMCNDAPRAIIELEHMGMPFSRTDAGKIAQRPFGGHTRPIDKNDPDSKRIPVKRACYSADRTGHVMLHTLYENCVKNEVNFFSEYFVTELLYENGICSGVAAIEILTGEVHIFHAKAVMFATGGAGRVWRITSNAHVGTGDGCILAYQKGLPLEDMEFMQFHPTGLWKLGILVSEAARGEGGILRNKDGERFMERYAPTVKDLAPRDMVSRAIIQEIREGRGIKGSDGTSYVLLDLTHLDAKIINEKLPEITGFARTYLGVEPTKEGVPIQPTAHYTMGGIPTDMNGRVLKNSTETVVGFYAAGECACVSVHGANRLGTNSLLDLIVFGRRGGKAIVEFLKTAEFAPLPKDAGDFTKKTVADIKSRTSGEKCADIRTAMQETMMEDVGIFRNSGGLSNALKKLSDLKQRFGRVVIDDKGSQFNTDILEAIELGNLLDTAYIVTACAENRKESRGAQAREDFPDRDDVNFLKHTMAYRNNDGSVRIDYRPVMITKYKPKPRVY